MIKAQYKYKLFGRFKGRKKFPSNNFEILKNYIFDIKTGFNKEKYNILDIGSGSGENAIYLSKLYPKASITTCELFQDGNLNLCNKIILNKTTNVSLFQGNVLEFLDLLDQKTIFDEVWILFPDPWPKVRHQKRRLVDQIFFQTFLFF